MGVACLKFRGEIFVSGCKIMKFMKVFSLESFPLYGTQLFILVESDGAEQIEAGTAESSLHESKGELLIHHDCIILFIAF